MLVTYESGIACFSPLLGTMQRDSGVVRLVTKWCMWVEATAQHLVVDAEPLLCVVPLNSIDAEFVAVHVRIAFTRDCVFPVLELGLCLWHKT